MSVNGFVWREAFAGPPNYESLVTDRKEVYWLLVLSSPIDLVASSPEDDSSYIVVDITRLQLMLSAEQYDEYRAFVLSDAHVAGLVWPSMTGHHHGDALIEVEEMSESCVPNQVRQL